MIPSQTVQDNLPRLKKLVESSATQFKDNAKRYNTFKRLVYINSCSTDDQNLLDTQGKASYNFNCLQAYISRLLGEFAGIDTGYELTPTSTEVSSTLIDAINQLLDNIGYESDSENIANEIYSDMLVGGYSVMKVITTYLNENSFESKIKLCRVFDPTLCGFDPYARSKSKEDGNYCYELIPLDRSAFEELYPDVDPGKTGQQAPGMNNFQWNYQGKNNDDIIFVCDVYEKKVKFIMKHLLTNGQVVTTDEYKQLQQQYIMSGDAEVVPGKVKSEQRTYTTIVRYRITQSTILEYASNTDFDHLPLVFFDGNSVMINNEQHTLPYVTNAIDSQRAKNIIGSTYIDEISHLRRTTMMTAKRALPKEQQFLDAYLNPEKQSSTFIYNDIDPKTNLPIPAPQVFPRAPFPSELWETFQSLDGTIQGILGAYDAQLGIQNTELSGKAIIAGATQSNAAAKPYITNYLASMNQVGKILLSLIPKIYTTPRTIPMKDKFGKSIYRVINTPGDPQSIDMGYDPNIFSLKISEGASYQIQKEKAVEMMINLQQTNPRIAAILASPQGTDVMLDNLDINGSVKLKEINTQMVDQAEQAQQNTQNQPPPAPDPQIIKNQLDQQKMIQDKQEFSQKIQNDQVTNRIKQEELSLKQDALRLKTTDGQQKFLMDFLNLSEDKRRAQVELAKASDQGDRDAARLQLQQIDQQFKHYQSMANMIQTHKEINDEKTSNNNS